jgi:hypothetical protein
LGLWRWTYYHDEGKPLAVSYVGHASERDCYRAIELLMRGCGRASTVRKEPGDTGRFLRPDFEPRPMIDDPFHGERKPWDP